DLDAAEDIAQAHAETKAGTFGLGAVSELIAEAKAERQTEAFVGHHASLQLGGGSATFTADATPSSPMADALSLGESGGAVASISTYKTLATIDPSSAARAFVRDNASATAGSLTLQATSNTTANADGKFVDISGFLGDQVGSIEANNGQNTEAYIGDDATVNLGGNLLVQATNTATVTPSISSLSLSGGVSMN